MINLKPCPTFAVTTAFGDREKADSIEVAADKLEAVYL